MDLYFSKLKENIIQKILKLDLNTMITYNCLDIQEYLMDNLTSFEDYYLLFENPNFLKDNFNIKIELK